MRGAPPPPVIRPPNAAADHQFVGAQLCFLLRAACQLETTDDSSARRHQTVFILNAIMSVRYLTALSSSRHCPSVYWSRVDCFGISPSRFLAECPKSPQIYGSVVCFAWSVSLGLLSCTELSILLHCLFLSATGYRGSRLQKAANCVVGWGIVKFYLFFRFLHAK